MPSIDQILSREGPDPKGKYSAQMGHDEAGENEAPADDNPEEEGAEAAGGAPGAGPQQATPEEQQMYDKVVLAAGKVLYQDDKTHAAVMKALSLEKDNPAEAIAGATMLIITTLDQQSKGTLPRAVMLPAADEIAQQIAELGQSAGLFKVDDSVKQEAGQLLVAALASQYPSDGDAEAIQQVNASVPDDEKAKMNEQQQAIARANAQRRAGQGAA